jgi:hypothetical protein
LNQSTHSSVANSTASHEGSVAGFRARCGTGRICPTQAEGGAAVGWRKQFKGRQFADEVILWAVRWYLMFPIS